MQTEAVGQRDEGKGTILMISATVGRAVEDAEKTSKRGGNDSATMEEKMKAWVGGE